MVYSACCWRLLPAETVISPPSNYSAACVRLTCWAHRCLAACCEQGHLPSSYVWRVACSECGVTISIPSHQPTLFVRRDDVHSERRAHGRVNGGQVPAGYHLLQPSGFGGDTKPAHGSTRIASCPADLRRAATLLAHACDCRLACTLSHLWPN